jgi:hypothetical protein
VRVGAVNFFVRSTLSARSTPLLQSSASAARAHFRPRPAVCAAVGCTAAHFEPAAETLPFTHCPAFRKNYAFVNHLGMGAASYVRYTRSWMFVLQGRAGNERWRFLAFAWLVGCASPASTAQPVTAGHTESHDPESPLQAADAGAHDRADEPASPQPAAAEDAGRPDPAPSEMKPTAARTKRLRADAPAPNPRLVPAVSAPRRVAALVGPGSAVAQGLQLYGTDLGLSFEHKGKLFMLFGDTWSSADDICQQARPQQDDTLATIPLEYTGTTPVPSFATKDDAAGEPSNIHLYRGNDSLALGYGQAPIAGFSDGQHSFAFFERLVPVTCDDDTVANGSAACVPGSASFCSKELGLCQPDYLSFPVACDLNQDMCLPGQTCVATALCVDPTSSQYDDGHFGGQSAALTFQTELGAARDANVADYDSVLAWHTNKFSQPAVRTVRRFVGGPGDNDYRPGADTLFVWGRPGYVAEQGRQAALYLMAHHLPLQLDAAGRLRFEPQYFAGLDAVSGSPTWSSNESDAQPLSLDGQVGGSSYEEIPILGPVGMAWLPEPISRWMMMYGGDLADYLLIDPASSRTANAPGSIVVRFAEQPWGPFSFPSVHLAPGSPLREGDPYGPGGYLYHPDCVDQGTAQCARSDPRRPLDTAIDGCPIAFPDPGRLYAPNIIDNYMRPTADGGLDVVWNVSTWNPYGVQLLETTLHPGELPVVKDELADEPSLEQLSHWRALPELHADPGRYQQQSSHDRGVHDTSYPLSDNGNRDFNNFICASPDAILATTQITPFEFDLPTCPESYVHGAVLGRFEGSGHLVRTWIGMQSLLLAPADDEVLRVYVDDEPTPRVDVSLAEALDGRAGEIFAPPFGAGSPRRLAWYYPIAFKHKLIVALDKLGENDSYFYHCDAVLDRTATPEPLPTSRLPERDPARRQLSATFQPAGPQSLLRDPEQLQLKAAETKQLILDGPATLYELRVRYDERAAAQLAQVDVRVQWDDASDAAIDLPLLELFAAVPTPPERSSLALTSFLDSGERVLALKLPMPFATRAALSFSNTGLDSVEFELRMSGETGAVAAELGRLHVERRETTAPTTATEHVAVDASGRGRLVGVCGYWQGHADPRGGIQRDPLNLLEGDVRARIDGELALDGTGTEEYSDDVFYFTDAPHARAFEQAWGVVDQADSPPGTASFCRWHVLGTELDFRSSIMLSFELGGAGNPGIVERVKTVAFYYLEP